MIALFDGNPIKKPINREPEADKNCGGVWGENPPAYMGGSVPQPTNQGYIHNLDGRPSPHQAYRRHPSEEYTNTNENVEKGPTPEN